MFYEGYSKRAVGKIMETNKSTVYNQIKNCKIQIVQKNTVAKSKTNEVTKMDELFNYIKGKT